MTAAAELFDSHAYEIPFPEVDGHTVDEIAINIGGTIKLNRNDPDHTQLVESLTLGRRVTVTVYALVASKRQGLAATADEDEQTSYTVALKAESLEIQAA